jgi:divalent metal cation (Fe/Co/Zn/Cd) transporter
VNLDAATAIPMWFAFMLARRKPTERFTYGYTRIEDLAGVLIVLIVLLSAAVAFSLERCVYMILRKHEQRTEDTIVCLNLSD